MILRLIYILLCYHFITTCAQTGGDAIPTLRFGTPLSNSVEVFISSSCASVTLWEIQYRQTGDDSTIKSVVTESSNYTAYRITGLQPATAYQFRARASQLHGNTTTSTLDYQFPNWTTASAITTGLLTIFGRVVLTDVTYHISFSTEYSTGWNESMTKVQNAYLSAFSIGADKVTVLRIERMAINSTDYPLVHYQVKVLDKSLPTSTDYSITGTGFANCVINNGDIASGSTFIRTLSNIAGGTYYIIKYETATTVCTQIVERYMIISPSDAATFPIHLNVADSGSTTTDEEDGLIVRPNGELLRDDAEIIATISQGIIFGMTPRFLIKDCLKNSSSTELYSEVFGPTFTGTTTVFEQRFLQTNFPTPALNVSTTTCESVGSGTSVTCTIRPVSGGIIYEILNGTSGPALATVTEFDFVCSSSIPITVRGLIAGVSYNFALRVTVRFDNGANQTVTSATSFVVTPTVATTTVASTTAEETTTVATTQTVPTTTTSASTVASTPQSTVIATTDSTTTAAATTATVLQENSSLSGGLIAAIVIASIVFLLAVIGVPVWACIKKGDPQTKPNYHA